MYRLLIVILLFNLNWAIGLKALMIPQKASIVALSNAGIGSNIDPSINPASIAYIKPYLGMSGNTWFADLSGNKSTYLWNSNNTSKYFSLESIGIDDIEYHIDNRVEPIGNVEAKWIAVDFAHNINLKQLSNHHIGYNVKLNYSKLHTTRYWGYTFDLGYLWKINNHFSFGSVIKNIGEEYLGKKSIRINSSIGAGFEYSTSLVQKDKFFIDLNILFDLINYIDRDIYRLGIITKFPYINLMLGSSYCYNKYQDFSYGLSFQFDKWMIIFGSLSHENPALGTPTSFEIRKFF